MEQWQQFQVMPPQLVPSRGAILLTVTSQGRQSALQKSRPVYIGLCIDRSAIVLCNKIEFTFYAKVEAFPRANHKYSH